MLLQRNFYCLAALLILASPLQATAETVNAPATETAEKVIQSASSEIMSAIEPRKAELRKDTAKLYKLVEDIVLPHFDFDFISRLVLGRAWQDASADERDRFKSAFQQLLVRTYSNALLEYSGEQLSWLSAEPGNRPDQVIQRAQVTLASGQVVPMNYRMRKTDKGWKVYDITIDNISLVMNYRGTFAGEIRKNGLGSLIKRLEDKNAPS